jgi:hypothetical protein
MGMRMRIILTVLVLVLGYFCHSFLEQYLIPQSSADLAVQQLQEDGSRERMRIQEFAQNWLDPIYYILIISMLTGIWYSKVKGCSCNCKIEEPKAANKVGKVKKN